MTRRPPPTPLGREGRTAILRPPRFHAPLLIPEFPPEVPFGFIGRTVPSSVPAEVRLQFLRIPHRAALELLHAARTTTQVELARGSAGTAQAEVEVERDGAEELSRRVASHEQELWRFGVSVDGVASTRTKAERHRDDLARRFAALGFRTRVPVYEAARTVAAPDLAGSEPRPSGYWHTLHTDGVASFFPFVEESVGEPGGILAGLHLEDASPIFLERFHHPSYSWGVFGTPGSGKSFAAALWTLRTLWMNPGLELVYVDPLGELSGLAERLGGTVVAVGPGSPGRWNPLDPSTTGMDRGEKAARVGVLLRALFPTLADEERARLDSALTRLYDRGGAAPTFGTLIEEVDRLPTPGDRLRTLLEVFRTGPLRYLDGPSTVDLGRSPLAIGLEGSRDEHLPFHLTYLLDAVWGRLRDRPGPKLVVVDEAHRLAADPTTAEFLDRLVRSIRHFDAGVLLLSQSPDDFLSTESGRSVLRNLRATFLLHLSTVSGACRDFFGLTEAECEWLPRARMPREAGYAEGLLRLGAAHLPLAVVASTPEFEFVNESLAPAAGGSRSSGPRSPLPVERDV